MKEDNVMSDIEKINENELDEVSGGMIFYAAGYEGDPSLPWEVVANNDCRVLAAFSTQGEACDYAKKFGKHDSYNTQQVDWGTVQRLRNNPNVY